MDPAMGIVGAVVIARWSWGLIRDSGAVLLDAAPNRALDEAIRTRLETGHDRIADLHVWRLGPGHNGAIVSLVADEPEPVEHYKALLADIARPSIRDATFALYFTLAFGVGSLWVAIYGAIIGLAGNAVGLPIVFVLMAVTFVLAALGTVPIRAEQRAHENAAHEASLTEL